MSFRPQCESLERQQEVNREPFTGIVRPWGLALIVGKTHLLEQFSHL